MPLQFTLEVLKPMGNSHLSSILGLVGLLKSLEGYNGYEMRCVSHVDRLISKLPENYFVSFVEHFLHRGIIRDGVE